MEKPVDVSPEGALRVSHEGALRVCAAFCTLLAVCLNVMSAIKAESGCTVNMVILSWE